MSEKPEEPKLMQLIQEKLNSLTPEERREMLAKIWEMIDEKTKGKTD